MAREKGKKRKEKKILIRVNKDEKNLAEELSKKEGKNVSEFFRSLLQDHRDQEVDNKGKGCFFYS